MECPQHTEVERTVTFREVNIWKREVKSECRGPVKTHLNQVIKITHIGQFNGEIHLPGPDTGYLGDAASLPEGSASFPRSSAVEVSVPFRIVCYLTMTTPEFVLFISLISCN
jgi:hypothetical protein